MTAPPDAQMLAVDLERVRSRIERIAAAFVDADLQARLASLRAHVSVAAATLQEPTSSNLARVAQRVHYAARQLDTLTRWPRPAGKGPMR